MEEDFYNEEYCYFDNAITELKEQLRKEVKQEIKDKIANTEKENEELKDIKENWSKLESEHMEKIRKLEREKENAIREGRKLPIKELFENIQDTFYEVTRKYEYIEKCNKCNDNRELILHDVYEREHKITCICKKMKYTNYFVKEKYLTGISSISKRNGKLMMWVHLDYKKDRDRETDSHYSGGDFINDKIIDSFKQMTDKQKDEEYQSWLFKTEEEAQEYANYLNNKEASLCNS